MEYFPLECNVGISHGHMYFPFVVPAFPMVDDITAVRCYLLVMAPTSKYFTFVLFH